MNRTIKESLEDNYAEALNKMPFAVPFTSGQYYCRFCGKAGVTIKYFFLDVRDLPTEHNFCSGICLNMFVLKRL